MVMVEDTYEIAVDVKDYGTVKRAPPRRSLTTQKILTGVAALLSLAIVVTLVNISTTSADADGFETLWANMGEDEASLDSMDHFKDDEEQGTDNDDPNAYDDLDNDGGEWNNSQLDVQDQNTGANDKEIDNEDENGLEQDGEGDGESRGEWSSAKLDAPSPMDLKESLGDNADASDGIMESASDPNTQQLLQQPMVDPSQVAHINIEHFIEAPKQAEPPQQGPGPQEKPTIQMVHPNSEVPDYPAGANNFINANEIHPIEESEEEYPNQENEDEQWEEPQQQQPEVMQGFWNTQTKESHMHADVNSGGYRQGGAPQFNSQVVSTGGEHPQDFGVVVGVVPLNNDEESNEEQEQGEHYAAPQFHAHYESTEHSAQGAQSVIIEPLANGEYIEKSFPEQEGNYYYEPQQQQQGQDVAVEPEQANGYDEQEPATPEATQEERFTEPEATEPTPTKEERFTEPEASEPVATKEARFTEPEATQPAPTKPARFTEPEAAASPAAKAKAAKAAAGTPTATPEATAETTPEATPKATPAVPVQVKAGKPQFSPVQIAGTTITAAQEQKFLDDIVKKIEAKEKAKYATPAGMLPCGSERERVCAYYGKSAWKYK